MYDTFYLQTVFRLQDIQMWIGARHLTILTCPIADIKRTTFATLTFTNQKNGVRGEVIGHNLSGHLYACPVRALAGRLVHLCKARASPLTPLNAYPLHHSWQYVTAQHISDALCTSATALWPTLGFLPLDVSTRSLRVDEAMALLCAFVEYDRIRLIGRWHSDEMLRYLHLQAQLFMRGLAQKMLNGGRYTLILRQEH